MKLLFFVLCPLLCLAQGYTSYFTGNPINSTVIPNFGICLMGGATENDNAMIWLLEKANGGDVVVIRSSGSNGYNNYFYTDLGVAINSVETLVITSEQGATNPYVLDKIANAELIWFAGGNQANYVNYFKDNAMETALNQYINIKQGPIGGTSAGMAILGSYYFAALNGSVTSSQVLANPFHPNATIGENDFLDIPFLDNLITDTHYDNPDRRGRQMTFMARIAQLTNDRSFGIASNEYVSVCVDATGRASVYGDYPNYQEFAYFLQTNCESASFLPENLQPNIPLTWDRSGSAVKVYKVPGTMNGQNYFELSDWQTGTGGEWENWSVQNGTFTTANGLPSNCTLSTNDSEHVSVVIYPNPFKNEIYIDNFDDADIKIYDSQGRVVVEEFDFNRNSIHLGSFSSGIYFIELTSNGKKSTEKLIKLN
jgi:cyanophycinase-like exopeptidase